MKSRDKMPQNYKVYYLSSIYRTITNRIEIRRPNIGIKNCCIQLNFKHRIKTNYIDKQF